MKPKLTKETVENEGKISFLFIINEIFNYVHEE